MAGRNDNFIPLNERTPEERRAICSKGGKTGPKSRVRKRLFKEAIKEALSVALPEGVTDEETDRIINAMLKRGEIPSVQDAVIAALLKIVVTGDSRAVEASKLILAQIGEDTPEKQEIKIVANTPDVEAYMR